MHPAYVINYYVNVATEIDDAKDIMRSQTRIRDTPTRDKSTQANSRQVITNHLKKLQTNLTSRFKYLTKTPEIFIILILSF